MVNYRRVKDEFRSFLKVKVPDRNDSIWVVWSRGVLVVRCDS